MSRAGTVTLSILTVFRDDGTKKAERALDKFQKKFGLAKDSEVMDLARASAKWDVWAANVEKSTAKAAKKIKAVGSAMSGTGDALTAGFTLPVIAAGTAAFMASEKMNAGMANIATLIPGNTARVVELKESVQDMAVEVGKSTEDLTGGLYQVISAFGDTGDTVKVLDINARAAAAGLATTTDAINLTSAVTKGYGDTSAEAVQKASDLAFITVKLGQTTFPELADSIGKVVPLAATLGVKQEELYAGFATLTGVTGDAAKVSTQLAGVQRALIKPTVDMSKAVKALGYDSAQALVESEGLVGGMRKLIGTTDGSQEAVGKLFAETEGLTAVFALTGGQADVFDDKLKALNNSAGATDEAFKEISEGINAPGFALQQAGIKAEVAAQKFGDGLAPAIVDVLDAATPLLDAVVDLSNRFAELEPEQQKQIVKWIAIAAAVGPALSVTGRMVSAVGGGVATVGKLAGALGKWHAKVLAGKAVEAAEKTSLSGIGTSAWAAQAGYVALAAAAGYAIGSLIASTPAVKGFTEETVKAAESGKNIKTSWWDFAPVIGGVRSGMKLTAKASYELAGGGKANAEVTDEMAAKYKELGIELDANGTITERGIAQMEKHVKALGADTSSVRGLTFATRDMAAATLAAKTASEASSNAELTMLQSRQAVKAATENLTAVQKTHKKGSDEVRIATLQLEQAQAGAAKATADYKTKASEAKKVNDELAKQTALEKKLEAIKAAWSKVAIATDKARSAAQKYLALNVQDSQHKTAGIQKARGGINPGIAQRITWGEDGPEAIVPLGKKYRSDAMSILPRVLAALGINPSSIAAAPAPAFAVGGGGTMSVGNTSLVGASIGSGGGPGGIVFGPGSIVVQGVPGMDVLTLAEETARRVMDKIAREIKRR